MNCLSASLQTVYLFENFQLEGKKKTQTCLAQQVYSGEEEEEEKERE